MADEFLSQDEVDALLSGTEEEETTEFAPEESDSPTARRYDLLEREHLRHRRLPAMEAAHERFGRELKRSLSSFVRRTATVSMGAAQVQRYREFMESLQLPCSFSIVKINPLRGNGLMICEPDLVFSLIETMFGGAGKLAASLEGRSFSPTERSVIEAMVRRVSEAYRLAWQDTYPLSLELVRSESKPQYAIVAAPDDLVITLRCLIDINGISGAFHLCLPNVTLDPIRSTLTSDISKDQLTTDPIWTERLSEQLSVAEIEMSAALSQVNLSFGELINLGAGDFIEFELAKSVQVNVNNVPFLQCHYGTNNGRYAVKINDFLTPTEQIISGASHDRAQ
ncbi:MAG: flagellar motor switch protein FliM [Burkholderiaceae bacterium]